MDGEVSRSPVRIAGGTAVLVSDAQYPDVLSLVCAPYMNSLDLSLRPTIPLPEITAKLKIHSIPSSILPTINATESYTEWTGRVVHRFLIIELLSGTSDAPLYIRLDRAPAGPLTQTILRKGRAQAGDKAMLCSDKRSLVKHGKCENKQVFGIPPTLELLSSILDVVSQELTVYTLWKENCYFFASLIQHHLSEACQGTFVYGSLPYPGLAARIRTRVLDKFRLIYDMSFQSTFRALLLSLAADRTLADAALDHSRHLERARVLDFSRRSRVYELCSLMLRIEKMLGKDARTIHEMYQKAQKFLVGLPDWQQLKLDRPHGDNTLQYVNFQTRHGESLPDEQKDESCDAHDGAVALVRQLSASKPEKYSEELFRNVYQLCRTLDHANRHDESCAVWEKDLVVRRQLYARDEARHRFQLSRSLHWYCHALHRAKRYQDACVAGAESLALARRVCAAHGGMEYSSYLSETVTSYCDSLRDAGRFEELCAVRAEDVATKRDVCVSSNAKSCVDLLNALHRLSTSLRDSGFPNKACAADAEALIIARELHDREYDTWWSILPRTLSSRGMSLQQAQRIEESCEAGAEEVALLRQVCINKGDDWGPRFRLVKALKQYSETLRTAQRFREAHAADEEAARLDAFDAEDSDGDTEPETNGRD